MTRAGRTEPAGQPHRILYLRRGMEAGTNTLTYDFATKMKVSARSHISIMVCLFLTVRQQGKMQSPILPALVFWLFYLED